MSALVLSHCESVESGYETTTVQSFDRHYAVNVGATWLLTRAFARQLPAPGGAVVALTSDHTVKNLPYGATKGALDRVVLAAAHELAARGVRANAVNPGPINTGWMTPDLRDELVRAQPTGRLGTPLDIAHLVRFLVSDAAQWVNGPLALPRRRTAKRAAEVTMPRPHSRARSGVACSARSCRAAGRFACQRLLVHRARRASRAAEANIRTKSPITSTTPTAQTANNACRNRFAVSVAGTNAATRTAINSIA